jgi:hypothetical protein
LNKKVIAGLIALPALVGAGAYLGGVTDTTGGRQAIPPEAPHAHATGQPALPALPRPSTPPHLQLVASGGGFLALSPGRWAVCYTYADARRESAPSPRYILSVPTGANIRIAAIVPPAGVTRIGYYVSPAANVVTDLRRYSVGSGADVIVSGPGTGPVAPE